jgi:hypothetical protein
MAAARAARARLGSKGREAAAEDEEEEAEAETGAAEGGAEVAVPEYPLPPVTARFGCRLWLLTAPGKPAATAAGGTRALLVVFQCAGGGGTAAEEEEEEEEVDAEAGVAAALGLLPIALYFCQFSCLMTPGSFLANFFIFSS